MAIIQPDDHYGHYRERDTFWARKELRVSHLATLIKRFISATLPDLQDPHDSAKSPHIECEWKGASRVLPERIKVPFNELDAISRARNAIRSPVAFVECRSIAHSSCAIEEAFDFISNWTSAAARVELVAASSRPLVCSVSSAGQGHSLLWCSLMVSRSLLLVLTLGPHSWSPLLVLALMVHPAHRAEDSAMLTSKAAANDTHSYLGDPQ